MPFAMPWRPLSDSRDSSIPKLHNLYLAEKAGLRVPTTYWAGAEELYRDVPNAFPDRPGLALPCIVRSGSPTEDTRATSNAGQFLSLPVFFAEEFPGAVEEVVASLPRERGMRKGVVFVQSLVDAESAGVTFFDGFYFEETCTKGGNVALTSGRERGRVVRGSLARGDARSEFLARVHRIFGSSLDIEWSIPRTGRDRGERIVLQVRPALFPIRRNETLSLANHKEILGDPPSPWVTGVLVELGHPIMSYFAEADPTLATWDERYAIELAERAWMNFSVLYRMLDRWGLPRTMITDGVGGEAGGPLDERIVRSPFLRNLPTFARMAFVSFRALFLIRRGLKAIDADLASAMTLGDLQRANVRAMDFSVSTNFAILTILSVITKIRRALGFTSSARVITQVMMEEYEDFASRPDVEDRLAGLERWLGKYGHRGPLESDPSRPRFVELRDSLRRSLHAGPSPAPRPRRRPSRFRLAIGYPFFVYDEIREKFRDSLMRWWARLRIRILEEARRAVVAGHLDAVDDVFILRSGDLDAPPASWRERVAARKEKLSWAAELDLPTTATRDELEARILATEPTGGGPEAGRYRGIGLGTASVVGTVVLGRSVVSLLAGRSLPEVPVLVAECLEPSWAVVFPRFAAVVADLGGELSHAAILLREAGIPSVVNARGSYRGLKDGDSVRVDPARGTVEVLAKAPAPPDISKCSVMERSS